MKTKRVQYFDLISGILMLRSISFHVIHHSSYKTDGAFDYLMMFTFFAMPWFYFKSGYFFNLKDRRIIDYCKKLGSKLIIPFFVFAIVGFVLIFPFEVLKGRPIYRIFLSLPYAILKNGSGGTGNIPLWFLLSLFSALISFAFLSKFKLQKLIFAFPVLSYFLYHYNINLPLGYSNLLLGIFFVYFGSQFRKFESYHKYFLYFSLVVFVCIELFNYSYLVFMTNTLVKGYYISNIVCSAAGIVLTYFLAKKVNYIKPLNYIGKNSIIFFAIHWPIIVLIKNIFIVLNLELYNTFIITSSLCIVIISPILVELINKKFPFLIGVSNPPLYVKLNKSALIINLKQVFNVGNRA